MLVSAVCADGAAKETQQQTVRKQNCDPKKRKNPKDLSADEMTLHCCCCLFTASPAAAGSIIHSFICMRFALVPVALGLVAMLLFSFWHSDCKDSPTWCKLQSLLCFTGRRKVSKLLIWCRADDSAAYTYYHPPRPLSFISSPSETSVRLKLKSLFMIYLESFITRLKWRLIFVSLKISLK